MAETFLWPSDTKSVSDTFQDHVNRNPPSSNPGTDIPCPYGSPIYATKSGVVTLVDSSNGSAAGRYVQVANTDGTRSQYLHESAPMVSRGMYILRKSLIGYSGGSGFGSDWGYGPHLHKSLQVGGRNVDFQLYSNPYDTADVGSTPFDNSTIDPQQQEEDEDMTTTEMFIRRELTGRVVLFNIGVHGLKANPDGSRMNPPVAEINRMEFFSIDEYRDFRSVRQNYNDNLKGDEGNIRRGKLYVPPADPAEVLGVTEGGWNALCAQFGV
jgi:murein DD-endopeptidase MepM/ murein hydrolase activator NlpD